MATLSFTASSAALSESWVLSRPVVSLLSMYTIVSVIRFLSAMCEKSLITLSTTTRFAPTPDAKKPRLGGGPGAGLPVFVREGFGNHVAGRPNLRAGKYLFGGDAPVVHKAAARAPAG